MKKKPHSTKKQPPTKFSPITHPLSLPQSLQLAIQYHQSGQLQQAETIYHQILQIDPQNSQVLHLLGVIAGQRHHYDTAIEWFHQAIKRNNAVPTFYYNLGNALMELGKFEEAVDSFQNALRLEPDYINAINKLGEILKYLGQLDSAAIYFQRLLSLNPEHLSATHHLADILKKQGHLEAAIACYQRTLAICPKAVELQIHLGHLLSESDRFEEARGCFQQVIQLDPHHGSGYKSLAGLFYHQGRLTEAADYYRQALKLNPHDAELYNHLGVTYYGLNKFSEAMECYRHSLMLHFHQPETHNNLGVVLRQIGKLTEALSCFQQALSLKPDQVGFYNNVGLTYKDLGRIPEAIEYYHQALQRKPEAWIHSNLIFALHYTTQDDLLCHEYQKFNDLYVKPLEPHSSPPLILRDSTSEKLKVGYISADWYDHAVAHVFEPILAHHDHHQFEIFCYYNHVKSDAVTLHLQRYADHWINCVNLSDVTLAEKIKQDRIDILVDLSGHTAGNRLLVFARKPAPVQVTYLGYPSTTGLTSINYRITDHSMDPEGLTEAFHSETLVRMPKSCFCYHPINNSFPVHQRPVLPKHTLTFGSLNAYYKFNPQLFTLWASILKAVPDSELFLKNKSLNDPNTQQTLLEQFAQLGIPSSRLRLEIGSPSPTHLMAYHQIDIALDSYPFTGGITTFEALWMGVPVVTLVGNRPVSRQGLSILSTLGLTECIAYTPEEYLQICIHLANNPEYLQQLRKEMRSKMQASSLMDGAGLTRQLEDIYQTLWTTRTLT